jgi:4-hydroxy-4-methyl-2-oxoglutarate aldolase
MNVRALVDKGILQALQQIPTCVVSNAIETFEVRLRNTGFADSSIRCMVDGPRPLVGYAATAHLRSGEPPMSKRIYQDRADWWNSILEIPEPRVVVLEDLDEPPGVGAHLGDMHASILQALGCVGFVTNGAVRELPRLKAMGFQAFAGNVAVSHAYAHIFDLGKPVKVSGLEIKPGDLLHGDQHGILTIPNEIAGEIPRVAATLQETEQTVIDYCRSKEFSVEGLSKLIKELS